MKSLLVGKHIRSKSMVDLREYYLQGIQPDDYYYRFYELIEHVNEVHNVFEGDVHKYDFRFCVYDIDEAIDKFKKLCQPENSSFDNEQKCWFYLISYYLMKNGYMIKEFPKLLERPPLEPLEFTYDEIRDWIIRLGENDGNKVTFAMRRKYVAQLHFVIKSSSIIPSDAISQRVREISTRQASFEEMSVDEKLAELVNLLENLLKKNGKFIEPDYSDYCFGLITNKTIMSYRKQLQCFRHSSEESIIERKSFSDLQKSFLVDYGIVLLKITQELLTQ